MNMEDKKDMQIIIKEHINLGLIEPGISAYSSPGFLIKMESESKKFTAFSTPQGQYIWNVLPMGLANAPQIFQRKMDNLFKDYFEFMFVYIDDILIASKNMKDHIKHLEIFSYACHKEGLVLSEKKATIAVNKIEFLGILIDEAGIELQEHIVEKIRNFPDVLKDKKQLQSFLGVVNFAGIFIKDLAKYRKDFPTFERNRKCKVEMGGNHTQRVRELKQVCNNLPKLAIPQDEDELVVYTDANDYRWAAVLMKKTTTGEEPCRYTGGLFTEQQAQVWHINEKEFFAVWKAFKKWPLFLLAKEFTLKVDNTNVKAFLKNKLESKIEKAQMEGAEANSVMLRLRHLRENLEELDREFGRLAVNAQVAGQVQRADLDKVQTNIRSSLGSKPALRVQGSRPVAADSSTACTRPSSDSGETATDESQGVKTSDDSSQPSTSGVKEGEISFRPMTDISKTNTNELSSSSSSAWQVYQRMWEKLLSRKGVNPSKTIIETTGKYNRVWMMKGSKPEEVREWYEFGALASVHTMSPSFSEISKLRNGLVGAPEMAGKGSHPAFHFIKLQRPDMVAFNRIKATTEEAPLVSAISEDDISTRRAWGLWVCLTEMDKVKYPFKIFSNKVNGSFLLNSMTGKSTEFAESMFEKKRMLIWENKLPATESTRMKACNMLHVGQWHNHVCPCCEKQEKPLFGTKIRVTQKKPKPNPDKGNEIGLCCLLLKELRTCEPSAAVVWLEEVRKTEDLEYPAPKRSKKDARAEWSKQSDNICPIGSSVWTLATSIEWVGDVGVKPPGMVQGHIAKFEVVKFDGTGNIGLWQTRVKDPLAQQGILKVLQLHKPGSMDDEDWEELQQCAAGTICLYQVDEIMYHVMSLKSPGEKFEVFAKFKLYKAEVENQTSRKIKYLRLTIALSTQTHSFRNFVRSMGFRGIFHDERSKLDPKSKQCIFLGYKKGVKGYKFWYPVARKMVISRDVVFDEQSVLQQHQDKMPKISSCSNTLQMELELHPTATESRGSSHPTSGGSTINERQAYNLAIDRFTWSNQTGSLHLDMSIWFIDSGMSKAKSVSTPLANHSKLSLEQCPKTDREIEDMAKVPYASVVDCLMYEMVCTRPNLAYVKVYNGVCFYSIVALSATEAEYIAVGEAAKEALWLNGARHIDVKCHKIRELIASGEIILQKESKVTQHTLVCEKLRGCLSLKGLDILQGGDLFGMAHISEIRQMLEQNEVEMAMSGAKFEVVKFYGIGNSILWQMRVKDLCWTRSDFENVAATETNVNR
ncbi:putative enzymatic polyprotein [Sesamum angolense]|uniref:Enzymatic polyprotein n=1 Tax=Sesamum angolense TaxID=2727404 RepID=A0AAE2C533_9LAMI|nr:putative enzymatic polyprotein [Sesamum angolense]